MNKRASLGLMGLFALLLAACASAPTQEMSDARQAVQAARSAGAQKHAPDAFQSAEALLSKAEKELSSRDYRASRKDAIAAKKEAINARNMALAIAQAKAAADEARQLGTLSQEARDVLSAAEAAAAAGDADKAVRLANQARTQAEDDARRGRKARLDAERQNQSWLDQARLLLEEARGYSDRMSGEQAAALQAAEQAYRQGRGEQARGMASELVAQLRSLPELPVVVAAEVTEYEVLRGDTLWAIAGKDDIYGDPFQWPLIYKANQDKIRDADLIYPGQVFDIERQPSLRDIDAAVNHAKTRGAWSLGVVETSDKAYLNGE
ncbi:MAG TPA: DUF4398 domain-containing protein [Gammaproteobacteria bacterium]|nr:DUF4398 domain-containing protein [Gammaproteobacteria bacterium]